MCVQCTLPELCLISARCCSEPPWLPEQLQGMKESSKHTASRTPLFRGRTWGLGVSPQVFLLLFLSSWAAEPSQTISYWLRPSFNSVHPCTCGYLSSQFSPRLLLAGETASPSVWTALFFPNRLTSPLLHHTINLVVMWEYLIKALLFCSPPESHLAQRFPPIFHVY